MEKGRSRLCATPRRTESVTRSIHPPRFARVGPAGRRCPPGNDEVVTASRRRRGDRSEPFRTHHPSV
ncbi:hypothetical protein GCM10010102_08620 [Promicromonospora citrea]|uniref:Uncharacterized protein n=1 Tax=Promicromonospora citrea TaxID=43677 RepID=A0A8H9GET2_9MICO|nr:hypothetical protein GCM10010102_08620 [Promicromonospora citrea]